MRPPGTAPWKYARKVVGEIGELKRSGVPSKNITVVGASKGAAIAVLVSHLLKDADVHYVLLAICGRQMLGWWEGLGKGHGVVYRPFEEWVAPTLDWSTQERTGRVAE